MTSKHTPGPWNDVRGSGNYGRDIVADNGRRTVAQTICAEHEANARLIAAAPDLTAACDDCDTAFAIINIGSDEGLTPQATQAMAQAWLGVCEAMHKATKGNHWLATGDILRTQLAAREDQRRAIAKGGAA